MSDAPSILSLRLSRAYAAPNDPVRFPAVRPVETAPRDTSGSSSNKIHQLIGARVPGRIAFDDTTGQATPTRDAIPMYRHPADRNAAAVAVELGRAIDVRG